MLAVSEKEKAVVQERKKLKRANGPSFHLIFLRLCPNNVQEKEICCFRVVLVHCSELQYIVLLVEKNIILDNC